jgi:hypothetical protein
LEDTRKRVALDTPAKQERAANSHPFNENLLPPLGSDKFPTRDDD